MLKHAISISALLLAGCADLGRSPVIAAGAAAGALTGEAYGRTPGSAAAGGAAGALLSGVLEARQDRRYQQGLDDGYLLGTSDAVKRLYWAKQALERPGLQLVGSAPEDPKEPMRSDPP
jgi:hypothetical protein